MNERHSCCECGKNINNLTNLGQVPSATWQDNENNKTQITETHKAQAQQTYQYTPGSTPLLALILACVCGQFVAADSTLG
jgi:hypothetical protein